MLGQSAYFAWLRAQTEPVWGHKPRRSPCARAQTIKSHPTLSSPRDRSDARTPDAQCGDHFNVSPGEIDWGHAGTPAHDAELLKRITGAAIKEGEHAL
jgi:hypothetical protein